MSGILNHNLPFIPKFIFLLQILNGYFVHYFAPMDLPPLPKNVVFVLDSSASMVGTKLRQVSPCMCYRLGDFKVVESLFQASSYQMDSSPLCIKVQCCQN